MTHRCIWYAAVLFLMLNLGCTTARSPSTGGQNGSPNNSAAIVGQVVSSAEAAKLLTAQDQACPDVQVSVNGTPVSIEFDDDCTFAITDVQPAALLEIRVELVGLGVAGTVELSDITAGELIEILVEPTDDSLTVSVERRTKPEPADELPEVIEDNNVSIQLPAGVFEQGLTVEGNNFTLVGEAGEDCVNSNGWTVITGAVVVNKNNATFRNIMFAGPVELHGNNAHFIHCCFGDILIVFGNNAEFDGEEEDGDHEDHDDGDEDDGDEDDDEGDEDGHHDDKDDHDHDD